MKILLHPSSFFNTGCDHHPPGSQQCIADTLNLSGAWWTLPFLLENNFKLSNICRLNRPSSTHPTNVQWGLGLGWGTAIAWHWMPAPVDTLWPMQSEVRVIMLEMLKAMACHKGHNDRTQNGVPACYSTYPRPNHNTTTTPSVRLPNIALSESLPPPTIDSLPSGGLHQIHHVLISEEYSVPKPIASPLTGSRPVNASPTMTSCWKCSFLRPSSSHACKRKAPTNSARTHRAVMSADCGSCLVGHGDFRLAFSMACLLHFHSVGNVDISWCWCIASDEPQTASSGKPAISQWHDFGLQLRASPSCDWKSKVVICLNKQSRVNEMNHSSMKLSNILHVQKEQNRHEAIVSPFKRFIR